MKYTEDEAEERLKALRDLVTEIDKSITSKVTDDIKEYEIQTELFEQRIEGHSLKELRDLKKETMMEIKELEEALDMARGEFCITRLSPRFRD